MKPFFTYFGGKWRAAPRYPAPIHDTIIEPFAGAAGYAIRHYTKRVVLVEKDAKIAALWQWLVTVPAKEIRQLPLIALDQNVDDLNVCVEAKTLIGFWLNKGAAQPCRSPGLWMRQGLRPKSFWCAEIRERVASQVESIRHWRVIHGSYEEAPAVKATWFIDPPYKLAGSNYKCSSKSIDFIALADWCRTRQGQVLVCENSGAD